MSSTVPNPTRKKTAIIKTPRRFSGNDAVPSAYVNDLQMKKQSTPPGARTPKASISSISAQTIPHQRQSKRRKSRAPLVTCGRTKCVDCARKKEERAKEEENGEGEGTRSAALGNDENGRPADNDRLEKTTITLCEDTSSVVNADLPVIDDFQGWHIADNTYPPGGMSPPERGSRTEKKVNRGGPTCLETNEEKQTHFDVQTINSGAKNEDDGRLKSDQDLICRLSLVTNDLFSFPNETGLNDGGGGHPKNVAMGEDVTVSERPILAWLPATSQAGAVRAERGGKPDSLELRAKRLLAEAEWEKVVTLGRSNLTSFHAKHRTTGKKRDASKTIDETRGEQGADSYSSVVEETRPWKRNVFSICGNHLRLHSSVPTLFIGIPTTFYHDSDCYLDKQALKRHLPLTRVEGGIFKYADFAYGALRDFFSDNDESELRVVVSSWTEPSARRPMEVSHGEALRFARGGSLTVEELLHTSDLSGCCATLYLIVTGHFSLNWKTVVEQFNAERSSPRVVFIY